MNLLDAIYSFRESADNMRENVMAESVSPWDSELLRRGLTTDPDEPRDATRDLTLGYAGSIGMMAMSHIVQLEAKVLPLSFFIWKCD